MTTLANNKTEEEIYSESNEEFIYKRKLHENIIKNYFRVKTSDEITALKELEPVYDENNLYSLLFCLNIYEVFPKNLCANVVGKKYWPNGAKKYNVRLEAKMLFIL